MPQAEPPSKHAATRTGTAKTPHTPTHTHTRAAAAASSCWRRQGGGGGGGGVGGNNGGDGGGGVNGTRCGRLELQRQLGTWRPADGAKSIRAAAYSARAAQNEAAAGGRRPPGPGRPAAESRCDLALGRCRRQRRPAAGGGAPTAGARAAAAAFNSALRRRVGAVLVWRRRQPISERGLAYLYRGSAVQRIKNDTQRPAACIIPIVSLSHCEGQFFFPAIRVRNWKILAPVLLTRTQRVRRVRKWPSPPKSRRHIWHHSLIVNCMATWWRWPSYRAATSAGNEKRRPNKSGPKNHRPTEEPPRRIRKTLANKKRMAGQPKMREKEQEEMRSKQKSADRKSLTRTRQASNDIDMGMAKNT